jgi:hypothetical protein
MSGVPAASEEHGLFSALEMAIAAADPAKREALAITIEAYARDFPDVFCWAIGERSPILLHQLILAIDAGCRPCERQLQSFCGREATAARQLDRRQPANREGATSAGGQLSTTYGLPELW